MLTVNLYLCYIQGNGDKENIQMNYFYAAMLFLGGIGAFLAGCSLLSDGIKSMANSKIRNLMLKTGKSKVVSCGIGALVTAAVQSSSVTTVMVVGLVNSSVMTLYQATAVIMGANIGTTITAQIAALQSFDLAKIAIGLAGIGVFTDIFGKSDKVKTIGKVLTAIGLVFLGLEVMSDAMNVVKESQLVVDALSSLSNPFILFIIGALFTAIIQSSSAMTTILISIVGAGMVVGNGGNSALFVVLGSNVGTCITAIISSIGAGVNAKRASFIHLSFNVLGSLIFFAILLIWGSFSQNVLSVFGSNATQIAMFHTIFNVTCTVLFLPFTKYFVALSEKVIKSQKKAAQTFLDERLLSAPSLAISASYREIDLLLKQSVKTLSTALDGFLSKDNSISSAVLKSNEDMHEQEKNVTDYIVKISVQNLTITESNKISALYANLSDIARVGEIAENITKYTKKSIEQDLVFSEGVQAKIRNMSEYILELSQTTSDIILNGEIRKIAVAEEIEDRIDELRKKLILEHQKRLETGECKPASSGVFINLVSNLERAGDHIDYVAHSVIV